MSVIITGMDMPKSCFACGLKFNGTCPRLIKSVTGLRKERLSNCPLKPVDGIIAEMQAHSDKTYSIDPYGLIGDCIDIVKEYSEEEK